MKAIITGVKRCAVHDGTGIRTTLFFKGCPLKCVWCHNPETVSSKIQLAFYPHKCTLCKKCAEICACHAFNLNAHEINKANCILCGKCADACPTEALEVIGREITVDEAFNLLIKDKAFYDASNGGVTLSGGECLMQADFCRTLLIKLQNAEIHTACDTSGFVPRSALEKVIDCTDLFLYDVKAIDESLHIKCTGRSNKIILDNLKYLDNYKKCIELRIPYIPDYNASEKGAFIEFIKTLKNVTFVRVLPYHNYAGSKYEALGMKNTLPKTVPTEAEVLSFQNEINSLLLQK